jgi:thymidylate synthase (FAD)
MKIIEPKVKLIGKTKIEPRSMEEFLFETGNEDFIDLCYGNDAIDLCAFYAKLCYKSLSLGHNKNITKIRKNIDNFKNVIKTGHGSVLEHITFNFVVTDVSRIETTEQIRHRVGQAISAESGRYCATDEFSVWIPDYLKLRGEHFVNLYIEYMKEIERKCLDFQHQLLDGLTDFGDKKKATSCARRMKPLGCGEIMGFSLNLRAIRHIIIMRTSRHAEEEIRNVFNQVAKIISKELPVLLEDMIVKNIDGYDEYKIIDS